MDSVSLIFVITECCILKELESLALSVLGVAIFNVAG